MSALTHKFGLELDLTSLKAQNPGYKNAIEAKILRKEGISYAEFSKEHPDIVIIEYDPSITTPDAIYETVKRQNGDIKKKVFL
jgi:DNA-directed RNA polymerase subunit L